jgi:outer membrane protein assembly factor BamB
VDSSPAVADGRVFVGSGDGKVYALNASTGALAWSYTTSDWVASSPAVADGTVFIGSADGKVYAFDASSGVLAWSFATGSEVRSSPAVAGGKVFVGSWNSNVYALDASTGALVWSYDSIGAVWSSPAVAGGRVFVGSGKVYALDASTGAFMWSYTTRGYVYSSPAVADGVVFIGSADHSVYALNAATGALLWSYATGGEVDSSPAVVDGMVFVGSHDNKTYALNAITGTLAWSYATGDWLDSSPAVADGRVFVGSADGKIYALDASTGALVWSYTTGNAVFSSPAVAGGKVFIGSDDRRVYAFGPYDVTMKAYCITEGADINVEIAMDGSLTGYTTTHTFSVAGFHTFTVPNTDASGHTFKQWNTGQTSTTIAVFSGGTYTAYYQAQPYNVTVSAHCITEGTDVNVAIAEDGSPTGFNAPHTFTGLAGAHTFTVPAVDGTGHPFRQWSTGQSDTTATVTKSVTCVAYYRTPPVHAIAITNITPSKTAVGQGQSLNITVTVLNPGDYAETFNVTLYANTTEIKTQEATLSSGNVTTTTFMWNTIGFAKGNYATSAYVWPVPGESDTSENNFTGGSVSVTVLGDVDGDFKVDMGDISLLCGAFGSTIGTDGNYWHKPPCVLCPHSPNCDVDGNGKIDMGDIGAGLDDFGEHYP